MLPYVFAEYRRMAGPFVIGLGVILVAMFVAERAVEVATFGEGAEQMRESASAGGSIERLAPDGTQGAAVKMRGFQATLLGVVSLGKIVLPASYLFCVGLVGYNGRRKWEKAARATKTI